MSRPAASHSALLTLVILILIWAYSWVVMKQVLQYAGPFQFAALRFTGGAVVLFVVLLIKRQSLRPTPFKLTLMVGLCQTTAFQALSQWALVSGDAGHTSLLAYTMPFWAVLLAWILLSERPDRPQRIGLILAAVGLLCVLEPWQGLGGLFSAFLAIIGGISWALGVVFTKRMFQLHSPSTLAFTAWQMLLGALVLCAIALAVPAPAVDWTPQFIMGLAYSVLPATSLGWFLWAVVVQRLPTAVASLSSLGVPVTAVLLGWVVLHERPGGMELVGIVFIASGLLAVSGFGQRKPSLDRR